MKPVVDDVTELTPEWLTAAFAASGRPAAVVDVVAQQIGTGQIGTCHRLSLTYERGTGAAPPSPPSLVAKFAGGDRAARERVKDGFAKEVGFYTQLAGTVDVRVPRCWYGAISDDKTSFVLLLDDLAPARPGVQADGCTPAQASDCLENLAGLHAPRWNDEALLDIAFLTPMGSAGAAFLGDILQEATEQFVVRYADDLSAGDVATLRAVARSIAAWSLARPRPFALVHGDFRPDNLMFPPDGGTAVALDWQTVSVAHPLRDVAYFLGTSLGEDERRAHEKDLVLRYHEALLRRGVRAYDFDTCFDDYRLGQLQGPMITVLGAIYATAERSARADGMFLAMATRSCAAIRDLGSLDLLA